MILQQLTVHNFCLFRDRQVVDLAPSQRNGRHRPVVLFGGINGGGKTTLFDAIQLALYGPRARCSKRANLSYGDFLIQCIHQATPPAEGAGVALSFRLVSDGEEREYEVRRNWRAEDGKLRENLLVFQDGLPNHSLSGSWPQVVEELIPLDICQLFFFDGEKIRSLAEDASTSQALSAAIKALLGLDIVERLIADATVVQTRLAKEAGSAKHRSEIETLEAEKNSLETRISHLVTERAALQNDILRAEAASKGAEEQFAAMGGKHWEERQVRKDQLKELKGQALHLESELLSLAASELPLALVPELLERVREQDAREEVASKTEVIGNLLSERDRSFLGELAATRVTQRVVKWAAEYLANDRQSRNRPEEGASRLELSHNARALLAYLKPKLDELCREARRAVQRLNEVSLERDDLERALAAMPAEEDIGNVLKRVRSAVVESAELEGRAKQLDAEISILKHQINAIEKKLESLWRGELAEEFEREDGARVVKLAGRTRETMQEFLQRATAQKIDRLSHLITESFRFLLRKQTLVERITIDPATFLITLYDSDGGSLSRQRLSEGEKQIFAISMLWGLARAASRPLPAVIDTPMARLDATHRKHLVERYFPNASHQVVIFSTDTEVDRLYYEMLQPSIARAYHLDYDEETRVTVGREGYFWKE